MLILALLTGFAFAQYGGLVCPSVIIGQDLDAADELASQNDKADEDDFTDGGFELDTEDQDGGIVGGASETAMMLNMVQPPLGGWLSIPLAAVLLRAAVHFFASRVGNYPFSMVSTVVATKQKSGESSLPFPFSLASGMASMVPGLGGVMSVVGLMQSISNDVVLFLVVFFVTSASTSLFVV